MNLTFITGNAAKAEQLGRHLDHPVAELNDIELCWQTNGLKKVFNPEDFAK